MRTKLLIFVFLCLSSICLRAQTQPDSTKKFKVTVRCDITPDRVLGLQYSLIKGKDTLQIRPNTSEAEFLLDYNNSYMIILERGDYTRKVSVLTTNIPVERWNKGFDPYPVLFLMYSHYSQDKEDPLPAATVSYNEGIKDFEYNKNEGYEGR